MNDYLQSSKGNGRGLPYVGHYTRTYVEGRDKQRKTSVTNPGSLTRFELGNQRIQTHNFRTNFSNGLYFLTVQNELRVIQDQNSKVIYVNTEIPHD